MVCIQTRNYPLNIPIHLLLNSIVFICFIASKHGPHHVAQKSTITVFPWYFEIMASTKFSLFTEGVSLTTKGLFISANLIISSFFLNPTCHYMYYICLIMSMIRLLKHIYGGLHVCYSIDKQDYIT